MEATLKRVLSLFRKAAAGQRTKIPRRRQTRLRESDWPLNLPLVRFSERSEDTWTLSDAFQGVSIMGENGSGKTSGSGKHLARKFLQNGFGGLVLCFKTDEADLWRSYLKKTGREQDGRFFGVDQEFRFNFMDYEARGSGMDFVENLVTLLVDVASIQRRAEALRPISGCRRKRNSFATRSGCFCWPINRSSCARFTR